LRKYYSSDPVFQRAKSYGSDPFVRPGALHAPHVGHPPQRAHHVREVPAVAHLHAEEHRDIAAVGPLHRHGVDVRVGVADRRRELGE
jgi:hypothetical protein